MLFSPFLWLVLPLPLHSFACWSFVGGGRLLVGCFGQKLYLSNTFIAFLEGHFELLTCIVKEHLKIVLHFHISINLVHFACIKSFVKNE